MVDYLMINQHFKLKKTIPWRWARSWDTFLGQEPGENCDPVEGGNGITDICAHLPLGFGRKKPEGPRDFSTGYD